MHYDITMLSRKLVCNSRFAPKYWTCLMQWKWHQPQCQQVTWVHPLSTQPASPLTCCPLPAQMVRFAFGSARPPNLRITDRCPSLSGYSGRWWFPLMTLVPSTLGVGTVPLFWNKWESSNLQEVWGFILVIYKSLWNSISRVDNNFYLYRTAINYFIFIG